MVKRIVCGRGRLMALSIRQSARAEEILQDWMVISPETCRRKCVEVQSTSVFCWFVVWTRQASKAARGQECRIRLSRSIPEIRSSLVIAACYAQPAAVTRTILRQLFVPVLFVRHLRCHSYRQSLDRSSTANRGIGSTASHHDLAASTDQG